jgi:putative transposase
MVLRATREQGQSGFMANVSVVAEPGRKKRVTFNEPGHAHELTFSTFRRLPLLDHDPLKRLFLDALDEARAALRFHVWAYVLMPEHVHVLVLPLDADYRMQRILRSIKQRAATRSLKWLEVNDPDSLKGLARRDAERGLRRHFWQEGPGYDRNLYNPGPIWSSIRYMHENPVRRGLVESAPDWPWSSARWYLDREDAPFRVDSCPIERPREVPDYRRWS